MSEAILEKLRSVSALYNQKKRSVCLSQLSQETQSSTQQMLTSTFATRDTQITSRPPLRDSVVCITSRLAPDSQTTSKVPHTQPVSISLPVSQSEASQIKKPSVVSSYIVPTPISSYRYMPSASMQTETIITLNSCMQTLQAERTLLECRQSDMVLCVPSIDTAAQHAPPLLSVCNMGDYIELSIVDKCNMDTQTFHTDNSFSIGEIMKKLDELCEQVNHVGMRLDQVDFALSELSTSHAKVACMEQITPSVSLRQEDTAVQPYHVHMEAVVPPIVLSNGFPHELSVPPMDIPVVMPDTAALSLEIPHVDPHVGGYSPEDDSWLDWLVMSPDMSEACHADIPVVELAKELAPAEIPASCRRSYRLFFKEQKKIVEEQHLPVVELPRELAPVETSASFTRGHRKEEKIEYRVVPLLKRPRY